MCLLTNKSRIQGNLFSLFCHKENIHLPILSFIYKSKRTYIRPYIYWTIDYDNTLIKSSSWRHDGLSVNKHMTHFMEQAMRPIPQDTDSTKDDVIEGQ